VFHFGRIAAARRAGYPLQFRTNREAVKPPAHETIKSLPCIPGGVLQSKTPKITAQRLFRFYPLRVLADTGINAAAQG
jgi:hypothetical protein